MSSSATSFNGDISRWDTSSVMITCTMPTSATSPLHTLTSAHNSHMNISKHYCFSRVLAGHLAAQNVEEVKQFALKCLGNHTSPSWLAEQMGLPYCPRPVRRGTTEVMLYYALEKSFCQGDLPTSDTASALSCIDFHAFALRWNQARCICACPRLRI